MKVILLDDVKKLGKKDQTVEVNQGYARNFLIPKGLVIEANANNMNMLNNKKKAEAKKEEEEISHAKNICSKLENMDLVIKTKAGENGKLFGSITSKEVSQKIKEISKIDIDKRKIELKETIKLVGEYDIEAKLYKGIVAKFKLKIEGE